MKISQNGIVYDLPAGTLVESLGNRSDVALPVSREGLELALKLIKPEHRERYRALFEAELAKKEV